MISLNKRAQAGLVAIVIILIGLVFIGWLIRLNERECNSNNDCEEDNYCGSDFACHQIPVIEKTIVKRSLTLPILILCATIVILAVIWRWENLFGRRKFESESPKETSEPYYSSQFKYSAK